ncbi:MAG: hypothetical protein AAGF47_12015, partial [Planctomycetota bacterium]
MMTPQNTTRTTARTTAKTPAAPLRRLGGAALLAWSVATVPLAAPLAAGQPVIVNPVYVDDSPSAGQVFRELPGLIDRGNAAEVVRALQRLLETEPDRLVPDADDPDLFRSVRTAAHRALLDRPELLERYRSVTEPVARAALDRGETETVERAMLLTAAGFDAALAVAEDRFRRGDFAAAILALEQLNEHPDRAGPRSRRAAEQLDRAG